MSEALDMELRIASDPRYLCVVRAMLDTALESIGYGTAERGRIALAVDEAVANVIRHGYEGRTEGPIWLRFASVSPKRAAGDGEASGGLLDGVRIVIEDEGRQVEPGRIRGRDLAELRPGGLGVHIIEQVMDEIVYEKRAEKGMRLTMVRRPRSENAERGGDGRSGGTQEKEPR